MMRLVLSLLFSLFLVVGAQAQTGAVKTLPQLQTEIGSPTCTQPGCLFPDNATQLITPFDLRQGLLDMTSTFYGMGGDCTMSGAYLITCTKTQGLPFAASSTTDTTNATNITSGSLALTRIAAFTTDQYLGTLGTAGPPTAINFVPCTGALTYTAGTGFGCNTTAGTGTVTNANIVAGNGVTATGTCAITTAGTCTVSAPLRDYIAGLVMSNDTTTPNTVLDISAGQATDSTSAVLMNVGAFTKTTGGAWVAGSGAAGFGNTVTLGASTWYHVCLANNGGTPDYFFDTVAACTNRPAAIADTKVRRIGSFKTTTGSAIYTFIQAGDMFYNGITALASSASNFSALVTASAIPLGVSVQPLLEGGGTANTGAQYEIDAYAPASTTIVTRLCLGGIGSGASSSATRCSSTVGPPSNAVQQIGITASVGGTVSWFAETTGYLDLRGKSN